jgi:TolB-like protein/class 3 adenylate cyclase/Tfp pilus assembly protein PilF
MADVHAERRLAAILAADVVGYSRLIEQDEAATLAALKGLRQQVIDPLLAEHKGRIVKLMGDGALVEFASVVDAVACAVAVQRGVAEQQAEVPPERRIVFRIGVNLGDVVVEGDDLFGDGINIAARLEQLCEPGGVLISGTAYDHLQGRLGLPLEDAGEQQVKNIERPVRVYRVRLDGVAAPPASRPPRRPPRLRGRVLVPIAAAVVVLLVAGIGGWWFWPTAPAGTTRPGIAVLPFDNLGGDEATGRLADGITEDIVTDLARFQDLDVIARNSTGVYKGRAVDVRQVGKDLGVGYVLEGSIQRQGDRVRVTAQLIDAESGAHVWSERWDRPAQDVFAVQAEIADAAAARIGGYGVVQQTDRAKARRKLAGSLTAYDLTILASEAKQKFTKESSEEAVRLATRAIEADPGYARAWLVRAWCHGFLANMTGDFTSAQPRMEADARRAVALDPNDAEAHTALGEALGYAGKLVEAKAEYGRAFALNPSSADIGVQFAAWSGNFGEPERGARLVERAVRLNPSFPPFYRNAMREAYFFSGRFEDAVQAMLGRENGPAGVNDGMLLPAAYGHLGDIQKARQAAEALLLKDMPNFSAELGFNFGYVFIREQERDLLVEGLRKAGLRVCATGAELAPYPNAVRLPECVTS